MADLINKSVTANDAVHLTNADGGVINLLIPSTWMPQVASLPTDLPGYWTPSRDIVLGATVLHEAMWAAAINIAITKTASKSWEVKSETTIRTRRGQALLLFADGIVVNDDGKFRMKSIGPTVGWVQFLGKHLRNFLCSDNGSFVEIIREKSAVGSRIIGLRHLSSARCIRTGDPDIPVLYRDKLNRLHELKDYQVMTFVDMPDPDELWNGTGLSAASRAYPAIYKLMSIERYVIEKVTGLKPLAIYVVNGIVQQQLDGAIRAAKEQQVGKGLASYMGAVIIGTPSDKAPEVATIPLAELPDRFARKEELDLALLTYSNNIGLDPQELQPLSGQGLGTGTQSQVLDDKASGKGLSAWQQQWVHQINEKVLDDATTFIFIERDYRDMKARADITNTRATGIKTFIDSAIITPEQGAQIMADLDEIPKEFVPEDLIPGDILSDVEKPESRLPMNKKPEPGAEGETGMPEAQPDEGGELEGEQGLQNEQAPEENAGENVEEEVVPDSEYQETETEKPTDESEVDDELQEIDRSSADEEESVQDEEEDEDKLPKKKRKSFDAVQFKRRDPLDALTDVRAGMPWGNEPLAIFANVKPNGKTVSVLAVKKALKDFGGDATFTTIHRATGLPYEEIFGAVQYLKLYDLVDVYSENTRVKSFDVPVKDEAENLLSKVSKDAKKMAAKAILKSKMTEKHLRGMHDQVAHGNRYATKPPPMPPQLNKATVGKMQARQKERVAIMEQIYPGVKFSSAVANPLGVKEAKKLGVPGVGIPLAIYDREQQKSGMLADLDVLSKIVKSAKKLAGQSGFVTFNNVKYDTGLDFRDIFKATNYLRSVDPYSVKLTVNRAGDAVNVAYVADRLKSYLE